MWSSGFRRILGLWVPANPASYPTSLNNINYDVNPKYQIIREPQKNFAGPDGTVPAGTPGDVRVTARVPDLWSDASHRHKSERPIKLQFFQTSKEDQTPLHAACVGGHTDIVRKLLENGSNADGVPFSDSKDLTDNSNSNTESRSQSVAPSDESDNIRKCTRPIHLAAKHGSSKIIKLLADGGASVDAVNEQKQSALHIATAQSNLSVRVISYDS